MSTSDGEGAVGGVGDQPGEKEGAEVAGRQGKGLPTQHEDELERLRRKLRELTMMHQKETEDLRTQLERASNRAPKEVNTQQPSSTLSDGRDPRSSNQAQQQLTPTVDNSHQLSSVPSGARGQQTSSGTALQQSPVQVTVSIPDKLKIFTGLIPKGNAETDVETWLEQSKSVVRDASDTGAEKRLRGSLRGIAAESVSQCTTSNEIINTVRSTFGSVQDPEGQLMEFAAKTVQKGENPSDFLSRLYAELIKIVPYVNISPDEQRRRLYRTFSGGLKGKFDLVAVELRGKFGFPGTSSPSFVELLQFTKKVEQQTPVIAQRFESEADLVQRVVEGVTAKLASVSATRKEETANNDVPREVRRQKGPCYRCGQHGHFKAQCRNQRSGNGQSVQNRGDLKR